MKLQIPDKLGFLVLDKARYKCCFGGRGGGKSWAIADCILVMSMKETCRILCTREQQNSIKDSVHRLLSDRISFHKLEASFDITENKIRCTNGSIFLFKGLKSNINEIKSLEGIKYVWVEEANKVSKDSWDVLIPTIRVEDSEIWISFNTGAASDEAYQRFVINKPDNCIAVKVNYYDNPWFPEVLKKDMEYDREHDRERYNNVWLGEPGAVGRFFYDFKPSQLREQPFSIERSAIEGRIIGSLDSGTTHATSFGLWYIDENKIIHRLMTYCATGSTIADHARAIFGAIESFPWIDGYFPERIYADPSMWTQVKLNEYSIRSPINEYEDIFREGSKKTTFVRANNDKINGCQAMKMLFRGSDGNTNSRFRFFQGYNSSFETGIQQVLTDENNIEIYAKQDGDDVADEARYGMIAAWSLIGSLNAIERIETPKTHLEQLLSGKFRKRAPAAADWMSA